MHTDVIIIGSGIAGVTLGLLLQRKGIPYVILNRVEVQKPFALGETLPPSAMPLLHDLQLMSIFEENAYRKTYGYHSMWGSTRVMDINFYHQNPYKNGLKIDKQKTLTQLRSLVKENTISYGKSFEIIHKEHGISIALSKNDEEKTIHGKILVDATGRNRAVLQKLNIDSVFYDELVSFSCHIPKIKHHKLVHEVYVESFKDGWGIVSALNETENIFTIYTHKGHETIPQLKTYEQWTNVLAETTYLKDFLTETGTHVKIRGGNANSSIATQIAGKNWLALGDAAISFDPLSSHGITNAIYTAAKASDAIIQQLTYKDEKVFLAYASSMTLVFQQYLQSKDQLYQQETRWKDEPFWESVLV